MAFGFLKKAAEKVGGGVVKVGEAAASAAKGIVSSTVGTAEDLSKDASAIMRL